MKKIFIDGLEYNVIAEYVNGDLEVVRDGKKKFFEKDELDLISEHYETVK